MEKICTIILVADFVCAGLLYLIVEIKGYIDSKNDDISEI